MSIWTGILTGALLVAGLIGFVWVAGQIIAILLDYRTDDNDDFTPGTY